MHDSEFIADLKKGDRDAFQKLVEQYQIPLLRLCNGFLHQEEDARDIVQDTFIEVIESIHTFREDSQLSTWLYRIAVNKSLNLIRRNSSKRLWKKLDLFHAFQSEMQEPSAEEDYGHPGIELEKKEKARLIRKSVDALPQNQRIAFVLGKYQDLSYHEIAEVMAVSHAAVESLMHRAKLNLQQKLRLLYEKNMI